MAMFHNSLGGFAAVALIIWAGLVPAAAQAATTGHPPALASERDAPARYVAIAKSASGLAFGFNWNAVSQSAAEQAAIANCGYKDCELIAVGRSECIALGISAEDRISVVSRSVFQDTFNDGGVEPALAEMQAIADCKKAGGKSCEATTVCSNWPASRHPVVYAAPHMTKEPAPVDSNVVGTWELSKMGGYWVLEVFGDGTYRFHSEAHDGVAANAGAFSASNGHWSLKATNGYSDSGTYSVPSHDLWVANGQHGIGFWGRRS
jgi:hypothetical protein